MNLKKLRDYFHYNALKYKHLSQFLKIVFYQSDMMSSLTPIFLVCCAFRCIFVVGYCCIADLLCRDERLSKNAHDDSSQPYGQILIMINDCKEYFSYDYRLAKSGFLLLVNPLKLLFSFKENRSMILGGSS
jgi:hypothetical protein